MKGMSERQYACNFSCSYCLQELDAPDAVRRRHPVEPFIERVVPFVREKGIKRIDYWGGEPLLYWSEISAIHTAFDRAGLTFDFVRITTNGSLLAPDFVGPMVLNPRSLDLEPNRLLAEQRIAEHAARAMEHVRPAAAARVDAERVRQAELALAAADEYADGYPLLGGAGSLHERALAVLAAAKATADRLAVIDVVRREANRRIRAATTEAQIAAVTLEIPE